MTPLLPPRFDRSALTQRASRRRVAGRALLLAAVAVVAGCATYRSKPLDAAAVAAALQPPKLAEVKIAAAKIDHPLMRPVVIDGTDGFTPDEIAAMTVVVSPKLRALRDQRGVAHAQVIQAGILPNPQLAYGLDQLHGANAATLDPSLVNGRSLGLSWEVTSLLAHRDTVTAGRATADALDLSIAWQEWQTAQDARLRAYRVLSLQERLPLARQIESDLAENVQLMQRARSLGQKTTSDLTTAALAWTQAQAERLALDQQLNADRTALNVMLGQPADTALRLKPAPRPDLRAGPASASRLLDGLEKRRLDLVALRLGYESEEATLRAAVKSQFPKIGLNFGRANDTSDVRTLNYGVTIDLPLFDRGQGQIAIGKATRQQLFDEYAEPVAEARAEVIQGLADVANTRVQLQSIDESLPALEQLAAGTATAFARHNTDVLSYHEARDALIARRIERSRLQQSLVELQLALEIATARPLPDGGARP